MTPEVPHVGKPNETDRPTLAEIAEITGRSDGTLLMAILDTDASRAEIEAAVTEEAQDPAGRPNPLSGRAGEVYGLLARNDGR